MKTKILAGLLVAAALAIAPGVALARGGEGAAARTEGAAARTEGAVAFMAAAFTTVALMHAVTFMATLRTTVL